MLTGLPPSPPGGLGKMRLDGPRRPPSAKPGRELYSLVSDHRTGFRRQGPGPARRQQSFLMVMPLRCRALTAFQTLAERVPSIFSCHPHPSLLTGIPVNIDAATTTICISMTVVIARNTVPASPSTTPPTWLTGQVTVSGSMKSHGGCTAGPTSARSWGSRSTHSTGMSYSLECLFLGAC